MLSKNILIAIFSAVCFINNSSHTSAVPVIVCRTDQDFQHDINEAQEGIVIIMVTGTPECATDVVNYFDEYKIIQVHPHEGDCSKTVKLLGVDPIENVSSVRIMNDNYLAAGVAVDDDKDSFQQILIEAKGINTAQRQRDGVLTLSKIISDLFSSPSNWGASLTLPVSAQSVQNRLNLPQARAAGSELRHDSIGTFSTNWLGVGPPAGSPTPGAGSNSPAPERRTTPEALRAVSTTQNKGKGAFGAGSSKGK